MEKVDIVIPWVDGNDPEWQKEKNKYYAEYTGNFNPAGNSSVRWESWDLKYWFRGIEKNMPWVNKIFFVTWGHVPEFLNTDHPKIEIVKHSDYIPEKYLPTFSANPIELNFHRIKGLSENFIYFNDDMYSIQPVDKSYFFKNNIVCDEAIEGPIVPVMLAPCNINTKKFLLNDMLIINKHFHKRDVQKKNPFKWFNLGYGKLLVRNIIMSYWYDFMGFRNPHLPSAFKKATFKKIWKAEPEILDETSSHKFRNDSDVNQYLMRQWQLCEGKFNPRITKGKNYMVTKDNYKKVANDIANKKYLFVCLNEECTSEEFRIIKGTINKAFEKIFPEKSSFEK